MITNDNDIAKYKALDKIYIPEDYINENYSYRFNGDYIYIITNNNCYTQYTTTYCDCYDYNYKNNVMSNSFSCNTNNNYPVIPYESVSDDINYSTYITNNFIYEKGSILLMFILGIILAILFTRR